MIQNITTSNGNSPPPKGDDWCSFPRKQDKENPRYEYEFAICLANSGRHIGGCGIRLEGGSLSKVARLGWAVNPKYQCKGYATEAAKGLIKFGFESLNILVAYATCDSRNIASYKVMEKVKMTRVGCLKDRKAKDGLTSEYRYEIYSMIT